MSGLIHDIEKKCLDDSVPIESLLRHVKLASAKLKLVSLESWVDSELNGYTGELPPYRVLRGEPVAWDSQHGWIAVSATIAKSLGTVNVAQGIGGLSDLLAKDNYGLYHFPIPPEAVATLNKYLPREISKMVVKIPRGGLVGILDIIRTRVLDWAIEMERNSVIGEDLSFDTQEIENARAAMTINNNATIIVSGDLTGNIGTGSGKVSGDISHTKNITEIKETMCKLRDVAPDLVAAGADETLLDVINAVIAEADQMKPDVGKLKSLIEKTQTVLLGAAGSVTGEGAIALIGGALRLLGAG